MHLFIEAKNALPTVSRTLKFKVLLSVVAAATCWLCCVQPLSGQTPQYEVIAIGLTDSENVRGDGHVYTFVEEFNESGQVIGTSNRYDGGNFTGRSAWLFDGTSSLNIGLTGSEHSRDDGYQYSHVNGINEAGFAIGSSQRFNGGSADLGQTAWFYNGSTIDIGLTGTEHTRNDGWKQSDARQINEAGVVIGSSDRYNGGNENLGLTTWLFDGTSTTRLGLTGDEYTRSDGLQYSSGTMLDSGIVNGVSYNYQAPNYRGKDLWVYDGAGYKRTGLTDAEHTHESGVRTGTFLKMNSSGKSMGYSDRYNGGSQQLGISAWVFDGQNTVKAGLTGAQYTREDGTQYNRGLDLNAAGTATGYTSLWSGAIPNGQVAWILDTNGSREIGLTGSEHTRNDGYQLIRPIHLNESGHASGTSERFLGGNTSLGQSAWIYDGTSTINIGLTGSEYTDENGRRNSYVVQLNEAGTAIGHSSKFGDQSSGVESWIYDGSSTSVIGLTGGIFTRDDGVQNVRPEMLNEAGQVVGTSTRYHEGAYAGSSGWFYDPILNEVFELTLSTRPSNNSASTDLAYLGEDGLVLGYYQLFDPLDNNLGVRAFYFSLDDGLHDLGSLGTPTADWEWIANSIRANGLGQIVGLRRLPDTNGQRAYLFSPVPEPNALLIGVVAFLGVSLRRKRTG